MIRRLASLAAGLVFACAATTAHAFTPESGYYWNPAESGSGLSIEIQDNYVFLIGYVYDQQGRPTWVSAQGFLSTTGPVFTSVLDQFINGQCIGCAYRAPSAQLGVGGPISLTWNTETTATLVWGGRTIPIQRFDYYLTRTGGIDQGTEKMLGEWSVLIDFYNYAGVSNNQAFPYYGDVLVVDRIDTTTSPDQAQGCRPRNTDVQAPTQCTAADRTAHLVAINYSPSSPTAPGAHTHNIVVNDDGTNFFAYFVTVGTYQFDGLVEICRPNQCGNPGATYYPVRGFRSGSRKYVQEGTGPSSDDKATLPTATPQGLTARLEQAGLIGRGLTAAEAKARYGFDPSQFGAEANALIETMHK